MTGEDFLLFLMVIITSLFALFVFGRGIEPDSSKKYVVTAWIKSSLFSGLVYSIYVFMRYNSIANYFDVEGNFYILDFLFSQLLTYLICCVLSMLFMAFLINQT